jgi:hypothetical protein
LRDLNFRIEDFIFLGKFATRRIKLEQIDRDILECFIQYPGIWAYRIYRDPKKFLGKYVDERTVRRCVRRLGDEGLIDTEEKEFFVIEKRGKKLSTCGIYYVFLNIEMGGMMSDSTFRAILKNYGENILFQLFLYPYLSRETLLAMQDSSLLQRIYLYLQQCCIEIGNTAWSLDNIGEGIFFWQHVPGNDLETSILLDFLEKTHNLPWVKRASLTKSDDNNSLWIRIGTDYVSIKLDKDKKTATMEIKEGVKQKEEYPLIVKEIELLKGKKPKPKFWRIIVPTSVSYSARILLVRTQQKIPSLLFDLASEVVQGLSDFETLRRDEKFMQSLEKIKGKFDKRYKALQLDLVL